MDWHRKVNPVTRTKVFLDAGAAAILKQAEYYQSVYDNKPDWQKTHETQNSFWSSSDVLCLAKSGLDGCPERFGKDSDCDGPWRHPN